MFLGEPLTKQSCPVTPKFLWDNNFYLYVFVIMCYMWIEMGLGLIVQFVIYVSSCNNVKWLVKCVDEFLLDQSDVNLQRVLFALTNEMRGLYLEEMTKCWWEVVWDKLRWNSLVTVDWTPWCSGRNLDHLNQFLVHESKYISVMYWGFWF